MADTPLSRYQADLLKPDFEADAAQELAVENLQRLYDELISSKPAEVGFLTKIGLKKAAPKRPIQGLYFWGGVGRGKTYLVDTFFDCLPFEQKLRMHFHRFMHRVHLERKQLREQADPLVIIGKRLAKEARVLCFDEFVVHDVADAVILARLMKVLFAEGVSLVATSNVEPVIWFTFDELCDGPRSQTDYIELAVCFHSILLSNVPVMDRLKEDQARRFINLVDVFYDHNVNLIIAADAPVNELYAGSRNAFEFERTKSRLQEMQSHDYLALEHKTE